MVTEITEAELARLEAATSDTEWNTACADIKAARGGAFPEDWDDKVRVGGVLDRFLKRFGDLSGTPIQVVVP
jgi:hypothetical protein